MVRRTKRRNRAQNAPASNTRVVRVAPRRKRTRKGVGRIAALHPYLDCVFGPVDMPSGGHGVPDGSNFKTIIVDHRYAVLAGPDANGEISFCLHPSPLGSIGVGKGVFSNVTMSQFTSAGDIEGLFSGSLDVSPVAYSTVNTGVYPILPHNEFIRSSGTVVGPGVNTTGLQAQTWRCIANTGRLMYTGDDFHNSGVGVSCRLPFTAGPDRTYAGMAPGRAPTLATVGVMARPPPLDFSSMVVLPGARIFPAREGADLINTPNHFEWQEWKQDWCPVNIDPTNANRAQFVFMGLGWRNNDPSPPQPYGMSSPGLGNADTTFVGLTGLQTGQTVMIEARTCIEYTVAFNSDMARMAKYGADSQPKVLEELHKLSRTIPSSKPPATEGWVHHALSWYGNTMKNIIGKSWDIGGNLLGRLVGGTGLASSNQQPMYVMPSTYRGGYVPSIQSGMSRLSIMPS